MARKIKLDKPSLRKASRDEIEDFFVSRPEAQKSARWLEMGNRYREQCIKTFEADFKATPKTVNARDLRNYVGASAPTHAIDGWSFLGRAVDATLRSDTASAIHFAYYAELRAAMSILASEGIGVFNSVHPIIAKGGNVHYTKHSTHNFVWPALRHWAGLTRSVEAIDGIVNVSGLGMSEWLDSMVPGSSVQAIAEHWMRLWGVDLRVVAGDHNFRNVSSYRPSRLKPTNVPVPRRAFDVVSDLWRLLEPGRVSRFPTLGYELLRKALRGVGKTVITKSDLGFTGASDSEVENIARYLNRNEDCIALEIASVTSDLGSDECHLQVICRAALLLVIASESSRRLLTTGSYSLDTLGFWWVDHGVRHGLWSMGNSPTDPLDAWTDIDDSIRKGQNWFSGAMSASLHSARSDLAESFGRIGGLELAGIWGLAP